MVIGRTDAITHRLDVRRPFCIHGRHTLRRVQALGRAAKAAPNSTLGAGLTVHKMFYVQRRGRVRPRAAATTPVARYWRVARASHTRGRSERGVVRSGK